MARVEKAGLKRTVLVFGLLVIVLSASLVSVAFWFLFEKGDPQESFPKGFFLGVTAGGNVAETKTLIDKVKDYTNLITFTNLAVTENKTSLEEVSDYAYQRGMSFFVFMVYPSPFEKNFTYNPITWVSEAKSRYGDQFLGYYLWDEPGGNQLDHGNFRQFDKNYSMPYDYRDAANTYVYYLYLQMRDFIKTDKLVTSDYGLYWYDYEAGYDVVLCELGLNNSRAVNIALCRGAAEMHNKTWGVMMTWRYENGSGLESPPELYQDMVTAYDAGAKYVVVFNYPQIGPYGLLSEAHFDAIKAFQKYVHDTPQNYTSNVARLAYVLPDNYGWGFRNPQDTIWGVWNADANSQLIWDKVNSLVQNYGDGFDIVFGSPWTRLFGRHHYDNLIWWNNSTR
jgi:hypothetical protein